MFTLINCTGWLGIKHQVNIYLPVTFWSAALTQPAISTLLPVTCGMLLQSTRQLSPPTQLAQSRMDVTPSDPGKHKADRSLDSKLMVGCFEGSGGGGGGGGGCRPVTELDADMAALTFCHR